MAKKVKRRLADDISLSLNEALKHARSGKADVIVHRASYRVPPSLEKLGSHSAYPSVVGM